MPFLSARGQASRGYFGGGSVPLAPIELSSIEGESQLTVSFTAGFDGGLEIINYQYRISIDGSTYGSYVAFSPVDTASPVVISGLSNGTTYYIQLRAINILGNGISSAVLSTNTNPYTVPSAPSIISLSPTNGGVTVGWTAPSSNGGREVTEYFVEYSSNSGSTWSTPESAGNNLSKLVSGLSNGTSYIFRVYANNLRGDGPVSSSSSSVVPFTIPSPPTSLASTEGDTTLSIAFAAGFNGGNAITNYKYSTSTDGSNYTAFTALSPADNATPVTISGLTNGTTYYVKLKAVNVAGDSAESSALSTNTNPYGVPGVSTINSLTPDNGQVTVGWTAASPNGRAVSKYYVQYSSNNGSTWSSSIDAGVNLSKVVTGLSNGTEYKFRVYAENLRGAGSFSATSSGSTPRTVPAAPTITSSSVGDQSYTVNWSANGTGGAAIDYYEVQITDAGQNVWSTIASPNPTGSSKTFPGLSNGYGYRTRVRAHNVAGFGAYAESTAGTPTFAAPSAYYMEIIAGYPNTADSSTWSRRPIRVHFTPTACLNYSRTEVTMTHESSYYTTTLTTYGTASTTLDFYTYNSIFGTVNISYDQNVSIVVTTFNTAGHAVSSGSYGYNTSSGGNGWPGRGPVGHFSDSTTTWLTDTKTVTGGSMARTYFDWYGYTTDSVREARVYAKISSSSSGTVTTNRNPSLWLSANSSTGSAGGSISLYDLSSLRAVGPGLKNQLWNHTNLNTAFDYTSNNSQRYSIAGGGNLTSGWSAAEQIAVYLNIEYVYRSYFNI